MADTDVDTAEGRQSPWAPLRFPVFRALFIAQLASNIGTLMQSVGSAWLMGDLGASPFLIALVPTASMLPVLLVGVPGGALADIFDRRRLLIGGQVWMLLCAAGLAVMSFLEIVTPFSLLALTFGLGLGSALTFPAFQAIQPELVPPREFRQAIALGSMTFNVGRAIGPAIGGFVVAIAGPGWVFLINAISFLAIVGVLLWWRRPVTEDTMPDETLSGAVRAGLRYAAHSPGLRGVLNRTAIFIVPAAALQALLPVVVRDRLGLGSGGYGVLLGCFGIGAASAAVIRPRLDERFDHDELVLGSSVVMAGSILVEGFSRMPWACGVAMFCGGLAWATALSSTAVSSFAALPEWVRARGLGLYQLVLAGGLALGSAAWGLLAEATLTGAHLAAAGTLIVGLTTTRRWMLGSVSGLDLRMVPTDDPRVTIVPHPTDGPVLVTLVYQVPSDEVHAFAEAMRQIERHRRRTGAYRWGLFRDLATPHQFIETFVVESWGEHLRQHRRTTVNADDRLLGSVRRYLVPGVPAAHYLSVYSPDGLTQTGHVDPEPGPF
ncbi:MAG TPA: MFS transporter [Ilumatobacteraceae bacterium]|nr:MFS transporter [Ilumatobacteraceae bacterium]